MHGTLASWPAAISPSVRRAWVLAGESQAVTRDLPATREPALSLEGLCVTMGGGGAGRAAHVQALLLGTLGALTTCDLHLPTPREMSALGTSLHSEAKCAEGPTHPLALPLLVWVTPLVSSPPESRGHLLNPEITAISPPETQQHECHTLPPDPAFPVFPDVPGRLSLRL